MVSDDQPKVTAADGVVAVCDAVRYEPVRGADYDAEIRCTETDTVEVLLSDGRLHPRCTQHRRRRGET